MKRKVKIVCFLMVVTLAVATFYFRSSQKNLSFSQIKGLVTKKITVAQKINRGEFLKIEVEEGTTALDLLKSNNKVKTQGEGKNAFVVEINGVKAEIAKKQFWAFYINGKMASVGAGSYQLRQGDKILWQLENY